MHERGPTILLSHCPTEVFSGTGVAEPRPLKIKATWTGKGKSVVEFCLHVHDMKHVRSMDESLICRRIFGLLLFLCAEYRQHAIRP
jgi:hypothetical protein